MSTTTQADAGPPAGQFPDDAAAATGKAPRHQGKGNSGKGKPPGTAPKAADPEAEERIEVQVERMSAKLMAVLPSHIPWETFKRTTLIAFQRRPELLKMDRRLVLLCIQEAAEDGLRPDGKEGVIVPRWSSSLGAMVPTWQPMYAGLLSLARNCGEIAKVAAHIVYQGEPFVELLGAHDELRHERILEAVDPTLNAARAVYGIAWLKDGTVVHRTMPAPRVREIKKMATAKLTNPQNSPWNGPFQDEMWVKTALLYLLKWLPLDASRDGDRRFASAVERNMQDIQFPDPDATPAITAQGSAGALAAPTDRLDILDKTLAAAAGEPEPAEVKRTRGARPKPEGKLVRSTGKPQARATETIEHEPPVEETAAAEAAKWVSGYIQDIAATENREALQVLQANRAIQSRVTRIMEGWPDLHAEILKALSAQEQAFGPPPD